MTLLEREPLLAELNQGFLDARRARGSFMLVSGEAGIGKTALVDAFVRALPRGSRVLRGSCDPVVPPRAFAPVGDMAAGSTDGLRAALDAADRDRVFERFLRLLRDQGSGAVVIFEDLHWADSATLDLLRVVGRRLPEAPVLVVGTYRPHDVDDRHPLRAALGDIPTRVIAEIHVPALTAAAVTALAAGTGVDGASLHEATGGNAFFVTEVLAVGGATTVPPTVRDAVAARVARLSPGARRTLEAAAVLGVRVEAILVTSVGSTRAAASGLRECIDRQLLQESDGVVSFRHELARRSVLDQLGPSERVDLNRRALAVMQRGLVPADDARMVQHAIESGSIEAIATLAPQAAKHASGLGAHGEAADYLAIVLALTTGTDVRAHAELQERYAYECAVSGRVAAARTAQEAALAGWRRLEDRLREGDAMRALSMYMWHAGEGDAARDMAGSAVTVLETVEPAGRELAHAYAKLAQLLLNSGQDDPAARGWAARARDLAERIGDEPVVVHALTTLALLDAYPENPTGPVLPGWQGLETALARARAAGLADDIARILINLVETARDGRRYDLVDRYLDEANDRDRAVRPTCRSTHCIRCRPSIASVSPAARTGAFGSARVGTGPGTAQRRMRGAPHDSNTPAAPDPRAVRSVDREQERSDEHEPGCPDPTQGVGAVVGLAQAERTPARGEHDRRLAERRHGRQRGDGERDQDQHVGRQREQAADPRPPIGERGRGGVDRLGTARARRRPRLRPAPMDPHVGPQEQRAARP